MATYSVVIPVFNCAPTLLELCSRIKASLNGYSHEIILVDDGSSDDSWKVLREIQANSSGIKIIRLSKNFGQHNALTCGFTHAQGDYVITMDDDLQHPPEEIVNLISKQSETDADIVYGIPKNRKHGKVRIAGSFFIRRSSKLIKGNAEGSSFRLIRKKIVEQIASHQHNSMIFIDEILGWYTSNVAVTEVEHHVRKQGKSGYSTLSLVRLYFDIVVNHSAIPLKLMTWIGFIASLLSLLLGFIFIIRKFILDVPIGFTALIVAVLFSASILMMCMGIIGQYLYKLFLLQNRKPNYSIREQY